MDSKSPIPYGSPSYVLVCGVAGSLGAGGTHLAITPLDLIKCRMQTEPAKYTGILEGRSLIVKEVVVEFTEKDEMSGVRGLARGWAPTAIGYGLQGFSKFGFNEVFKMKAAQLLGDDTAHKYRLMVYGVSAALAEGIGDVFLAPFEAAKVRTQTDASAPRTLRECLPLIYRENGMGGLFKGLYPLWMRQIPYTVSQFVCFEYATTSIYKHVMPKPRADCSRSEQMRVTFVAASLAGIVCAVVSHPPDVLVSLMYKNSQMTFGQACRKMGVSGMWAGLPARLLMISSIAAAQLFIVDAVKLSFGLENKK